MDEKHDQTLAMLNDESHLPRARINENRSVVNRVTYSAAILYLDSIDWIS